MKSQSVSLLVITLLLATVLVSCEGQPEPNPKHYTGEITVILDASQQAIFPKAKEQFEKSYPGAKVTIQTKSFKSLDDMKSYIQSKDAPDVISLSSIGVQYVQGDLKNLNEITRMENVRLDDFYSPNILRSASMNGKQLLIPMRANSPVVFYNKEIFNRMGISPPAADWTWEDFAEKAGQLQKMSDKTNHTFGTVFPVSNTYMLSALAMRHKGSFISQDGSTLEGYLNGAETVAAIDWLSTMVKHNIISPDGVTYPGQYLANGKMGMYVGSYPVLNQVPIESRDIIGIAPFPKFYDRVSALNGSMFGLAVTKKSKNPSLAWRFLDFIALSKNEISSEFISKYDYGLAKTATEPFKDDPLFKVKLESLQDVGTDPLELNPNYYELMSILGPELRRIVTDGGNTQEELTHLVKTIQDRLNSK